MHWACAIMICLVSSAFIRCSSCFLTESVEIFKFYAYVILAIGIIIVDLKVTDMKSVFMVKILSISLFSPPVRDAES